MVEMRTGQRMASIFREVGSYFKLAYGDTYRMLRDMRLSVMVAAGATIGALIMGQVVGRLLVQTDLGQTVAQWLVAVVGLYVAAPYTVALYRYVILEHVETKPERLRADPATLIFFAWSAVLNLAATVPEMLRILTQPNGLAPGEPVFTSYATSMLIMGAAVLVLAVLAMRIVTFLPNLAVDARNASLQRTWMMTRGRFWLIWLTAMLAGLPIVLASPVILTLATALPNQFARLLTMFVAGVGFMVVLMLVGTSVSARLYQRLASEQAAA